MWPRDGNLSSRADYRCERRTCVWRSKNACFVGFENATTIPMISRTHEYSGRQISILAAIRESDRPTAGIFRARAYDGEVEGKNEEFREFTHRHPKDVR